jgi:biotin-dependent carboxylase-like uncharacterized protein
MIKVIKPGFFSSIQDLGRPQYRRYGVPISGAMDIKAYRRANLLLNNVENEAAIEMTLVGASLHFMKPALVAITGANMSPKLNGNSIPMYTTIVVPKNAKLTFDSCREGSRTYVGVKGGIQVDTVLGSRSYLPGLTSSYLLKNNQELPIISNTDTNTQFARLSPPVSQEEILVYKGPEFHLLSNRQQRQLINTNFTIGENNRMAYFLKEPLLNKLTDVITSAVLPGTVQLTPSGKLIVLMSDAQTTGGYPRILQVTAKSMSMLGQKRVNNKVKFVLQAIDESD